MTTEEQADWVSGGLKTASSLVLSIPIKHGYYMKTTKIR